MKKKSRAPKESEDCNNKIKNWRDKKIITKDSKLIESCPKCERLNYSGYTDYTRWIGK